MAKGKTPRKRSGPGAAAKVGKGLFSSVNKALDWWTTPRAAKARRASVEWTSKPGGRGEHLPLAAQRGLAWGARQTHADKEWWRVSFIAGPTEEFLTWPPRDHTEACQLARDYVVKRFGVFAESWEISVVEFARKAVEDELPEDAKA